MPKRITHEDFLKQVEEKYEDRFIVLEKYRSANKKIQIKCRECGDIKNVTPASFIRQKIGCKKCYHNSRIITFKEEQKRISEMTNNEYTLISKDNDTRGQITIRHELCGYEYKTYHGSFIYSGKRCRKCYGTATWSLEEWNNFLTKNMHDYKMLSEYSTGSNKVKIQHSTCGREWWVEPRALKMGVRCTCIHISKGERIIKDILENKKIKFISQFRIEKCKDILPLPFDFAVLNEGGEISFLLEYQGIQHFKPSTLFGEESFKDTQKHDKIKIDYCKTNNIKLFHINYNENIEKSLNNILNNNQANLEPSYSEMSRRCND